MAKVFVLDVYRGKVRVADCVELDDFYRELNCDTFDIVHRSIGERYFDIFCDDNGLFAKDIRVSAVDKDGKPALVGNLVFANHDDEGNTTSLSQEDIDWLTNHLAIGIKNGKAHPVIYPCEY